LSNLVDEYYETAAVSKAKLLNRGQLCWGPGLYLPSHLSTLELVHYDPKNERLNQYKVLSNPPANIVFNHMPVHELKLEHDEELLVIKAKRRLLIVMSQAPTSWPLGGARLKEQGYVCLPRYSFHPADSPEFRTRVKALEYPWWIHTPGESSLGINDGFIRLDRIQVVEKSLLEPIPVILTEWALLLISEWLRYFLTGQIDSLFLEDRQEMLDGLK
jgi:hypothetical protein